MKFLNLLSIIALMRITNVSAFDQDRDSSIGNTADPSDQDENHLGLTNSIIHETDENDRARVLMPAEEDKKSAKKGKGSKSQKSKKRSKGSKVNSPGNSFRVVPVVSPTNALASPSESPTDAPTNAPTESPTNAPTEAPTEAPTNAPTKALTEAQTDAPTDAPTNAPTEAPTDAPTDAPTNAPTEAPTDAPTNAPTEAPTEAPTDAPTNAPTEAPTDAPTNAPTEAPTDAPTNAPTEAPTEAPTDAPTNAPTEAPTDAPTNAPTDAPTDAPTAAPTDAPTDAPTAAPTDAPTKAPRNAPLKDPYWDFARCAQIAALWFDGGKIKCGDQSPYIYETCERKGLIVEKHVRRGERCHNNEILTCDKLRRFEGLSQLTQSKEIYCADQCSHDYLTCENGEVVAKAMPAGEKCYENRAVYPSEGHCVLTDEADDMILTFDVVDDCMNYPNLDHCLSPTDEAPPYIGQILEDNAWHWIDEIIVTYNINTLWRGEKTWDIFYTIKFGHDKHERRKMIFRVNTDFGTTRILRWSSWETLDDADPGWYNDPRIPSYNCQYGGRGKPPTPINLFIEKVVYWYPALLVTNTNGVNEIKGLEEDTSFTAEVRVKAEEIGETYLKDKNKLPGMEVSVMAKGMIKEDDNRSDPVKRPPLTYRNVLMFKKENFLPTWDGGRIPWNWGDILKHMRNIGKGYLKHELRSILVTQSELITNGISQRCRLYQLVPIYHRAVLGTELPQNERTQANREKVPEAKVRAARDDIERSRAERESNRRILFPRRLVFENDTWVKQSKEDFVQGDDDPLKTNITALEMVKNFANDLDPETLQELTEQFLGTGPGLPDAAELLATFVRIDTELNKIYDFAEGVENGVLSAYTLIQNVEGISPLLGELRDLVFAIDTGLSLISIIKQIKPFLTPVRQALDRVDDLIEKAEEKMEDFNKTKIAPNKPKVQKVLNSTEKAKGIVAKTVYVNKQLFVNPINVTRNCPAVDTMAKFVNEQTQFVTDPILFVVESTTAFLDDVKEIIELLQTPFDILNQLFEGVYSISDNVDFLEPIVQPFSDLLNEPISLTLPGPWCSATTIIELPYPCGTIDCCSDTWFGRICVPCGVKVCWTRDEVVLPSWCDKTWTFTVMEILDGITGILDFLSAPFDLIIEGLVNVALDLLGIDLNNIPLPGLDVNLDDLSIQDLLPAGPDFLELIELPEPFDKFAKPEVIDRILNEEDYNAAFVVEVLNDLDAFDGFSPICESTD